MNSITNVKLCKKYMHDGSEIIIKDHMAFFIKYIFTNIRIIAYYSKYNLFEVIYRALSFIAYFTKYIFLAFCRKLKSFIVTFKDS